MLTDVLNGRRKKIMDKQEVIEILNRHKKLTCHDCIHPQQVGYCEKCKLSQAFDVAIEALECEECDDTISRKMAIEALAKMMPKSMSPDGSHPADEEIFKIQEVFADCITTIELLPFVTPKRPTGEGEVEECEDAISRKELAEALDTWPKYGVDERGRIVNWHEGLVPYVKCLDVFMALSNSPSVKPKRPTGHWIEERDCEGKKRWLTCSVCGYKTDDYYFNNPNYCSHCGADLRGDKE